MTYALHPNTSLGLVKLKISNLEKSIAFYEKVIGLKSINVTNKTAQLSANGITPLLELEQIDQPYTGSKRGHTGLYHFALLLPTRKALGKVLQHFVNLHVPIGQADHLVSEALYLSDLDGNGIEIYRDRPRDEWKLDERGLVKMASDPIDWEGILAEAKGEVFTGLDEGTIMGHMHLHVSSLPAAKKYYCDIMGFNLEADWSFNGAYFVAAGGYHHHLGLNVWNGQGIPPLPDHATGLAYYTIVLANHNEWNTLKQRLEAHSYSVTVTGNEMLTTDPFGIQIKLTY